MYWISADSLIRYKTEEHFGCINCNLSDFNDRLEKNKLRKIQRNVDGTTRVQCLRCDSVFDGFVSHFVDPKFICQYCGYENKRLKILENPEFYKDRTVKETMKQAVISYRIAEGSLMWFYVLGLLLADGHFTYSTERISLTLKRTDADSVYSVAEFLCSKVRINSRNACFDVCSPDVKKLMAYYKISDRKTYEPCDISSISGDKMIAFIIGFIDGDGYIGKRTDTGRPDISIKLHKSWRNNLLFMSECLYTYFGIERFPKPITVKQKNGEYSQVTWGDTRVTTGLFEFIKSNDIPAMKRKWAKIEELEKELMTIGEEALYK